MHIQLDEEKKRGLRLAMYIKGEKEEDSGQSEMGMTVRVKNGEIRGAFSTSRVPRAARGAGGAWAFSGWGPWPSL